MQEKDIQGILQKVDELKSVFTFGVRFIPFLEDLLVFVQEMAPMLNEMNQSIQDSSSKMPKAVQQLDKVTSATELATNEILDKVDSMLTRLDEVNNNFGLVSKRMAAEQTALTSIAGAIEELLAVPGVRESLNRVFEDSRAREKGIEIKRIVDEFLEGKVDESIPGMVDQALQDTRSDAYDIMNALQVQDITAQQIEGAHSLLRSVQERLNGLIAKYSEAEPPQVLRETKAHDMHASYTDAEERQKNVDEAVRFAEEEVLTVESEDEENHDAEEIGEAEALPESSAFDSDSVEELLQEAEEPDSAEIEELLSWGGDEEPAAALPGEESEDIDLPEIEIELEEEFGDWATESAEPSGENGTGESVEETDESLAAGDIDLDAMLGIETPGESVPGPEQAESAGDDTAGEKESTGGGSEDEPDDEAQESEEDINLKISQEEIDRLFQ